MNRPQATDGPNTITKADESKFLGYPPILLILKDLGTDPYPPPIFIFGGMMYL